MVKMPAPSALRLLLFLALINICLSPREEVMAAHYKAVAAFSNHNEVLVGDVNHSLWLGRAEIVVKGLVTGMVCTGVSHVTEMNPFAFGCNGQKGVANLTCSDGRIVTANWVAESCTSGYGTGYDQNGNAFTFVFGLNTEQAMAYLRRLMPQAAMKPDLPKIYDPAQTRAERGIATGTGFLVSPNGIIVTNYHVVDGAGDIEVKNTFTDEVFKANVLKKDEGNDIAIIKIDASSLPFLSLASGPTPRRGEDVIALGYPMIHLQGQEQKATFGRVNAQSGPKDDARYLQMDAPIQPGNSGGPLLNASGEVVGINTMTLSVGAVSSSTATIPQNVNYSVKIGYALPLVNDVLADYDMKIKHDGDASYSSMADVVEATERAVLLIITR